MLNNPAFNPLEFEGVEAKPVLMHLLLSHNRDSA